MRRKEITEIYQPYLIFNPSVMAFTGFFPFASFEGNGES